MPSRGTYRTVHSSLPDDPDFQRLSVNAKLVFHTLRLCREHRASGIFRYYLPTIAARTGMTQRQVTSALAEPPKGFAIAPIQDPMRFIHKKGGPAEADARWCVRISKA